MVVLCLIVELPGMSLPASRDRPSLGSGPANRKQPPCCAWFFYFSQSPSESKLSSGLAKNKNPLSGVVVFCLIVELPGIEPGSRQGDHMLSTCLSCLDCRGWPGGRQPNHSLSPLFSPSGRRDHQAIPELRALPYRVGTGHHRPGNVSSQHLVPGLSITYLVRLRSKSVVILASYCCETQVIEMRHPTLHAYIPPRLAVKTRSAPCNMYYGAKLSIIAQ